jgi:hypothetical protein
MREGKNVVIISVLISIIFAVVFVTLTFVYTPMMDWLIQVVQLSPSILLCFLVAVILLIGSLVLGIIFIRRNASFWRWLILFVLVLFFGCTSGMYGSFYFLSKGNEDGCITKDCVWFD